MKRLIPLMMLAVLCGVWLTTAVADGPSEQAGKTATMLKDRGVMAFVDKAAGFVHLMARQDLGRIEKAYGINDQMKEIINAPELTDALKSIDTSLPFSMDLAAFDMLDAQTCSMLFIIHGSDGPIAIKVYMMPTKNTLVHRVEVILDWEEIEKLAHRMEKLPGGYNVQVTRLQEERPQ